MNKSTFPTYCDYYYRCRIFNVEEAKREYTKCNDFLLGSDIVESPAMKILTDKPEEERKEIYKAYKKLCDDFKSIAQMLIDKDGIESEEDYIHGMELLMLIANRTIMFTSEEFCLHGGAYLNEKYVYAGKYMRLSEIIKKNDNTPYYLNPDDVATIFVDKYGTAILWIRVLCYKNFFLFRHSNMRINLGCSDRTMAKKFLDVTYVYVFLKKQGSK